MRPSSLAKRASQMLPEVIRKHDPGHALFAFMVQRNAVLAASHNLTGRISCLPRTTSPCSRFGYKRDSVHAEVAAVKKGMGKVDRRKPWHIVVMRLAPGGQLRLAKPCPICQAYLKAQGCSHAIYSDSEGDMVQLCLS
jgi:hypothetical protein